MTSLTIPPDDSAVYQRTTHGQQALLQAEDIANSPTLRVLARVNGYTDLKDLKRLAANEAAALISAVQQLAAQGLIKLVDD